MSKPAHQPPLYAVWTDGAYASFAFSASLPVIAKIFMLHPLELGAIQQDLASGKPASLRLDRARPWLPSELFWSIRPGPREAEAKTNA